MLRLEILHTLNGHSPHIIGHALRIPFTQNIIYSPIIYCHYPFRFCHQPFRSCNMPSGTCNMPFSICHLAFCYLYNNITRFIYKLNFCAKLYLMKFITFGNYNHSLIKHIDHGKTHCLLRA